jgi:hypothetical protein
MKNTDITPRVNINGEEFVDFSYQEAKRDRAIVDLKTLQRLISFLPSASYRAIKERLMGDIAATRSVQELVLILQEELAFQTTVNVISNFAPQEKEEITIDQSLNY